MKLLHITCTYPPSQNGISHVAHDYVRVLREAGHTVDVVSPTTRKPLLHIGHGALFLRLLFDVRHYECVHLHYPFFGSSFVTALACFVWRKPLFITYHMTVQIAGWRGFYIWLHHRYIEPFILRIARAVLISTTEYAELIHVSHARLIAFPFTVNTDIYTPISHKENKTCCFVFVGGMDRQHYFKGIDILLSASARLVGDWKLLLVGDGILRHDYEKQAERLGIQDHIEFAGSVEKTVSYYQASHVHILPSINSNEAFGLVTLEAMACGIPSIVSKLPGVKTLVIPGKTGWHVAPHSVEDLRRAMQEAIDSPDIRWRYGQSARDRVLTHYAEKDLAKRLIDVYQEEYEDRNY